MNTNHTQHRKELTALDADVPLLRPSSIGATVSELRMFKDKWIASTRVTLPCAV
jgi:hypothetical protein